MMNPYVTIYLIGVLLAYYMTRYLMDTHSYLFYQQGIDEASCVKVACFVSFLGSWMWCLVMLAPCIQIYRKRKHN